ncbi:unnamed protein product [Linum trigynum]|uniref:Aminotransferase-like plant mobile domain-containing protein n=1 Tax=Linum trigynum TaxID=586398 RepID=A0AAV2FI28_9ROSI
MSDSDHSGGEEEVVAGRGRGRGRRARGAVAGRYRVPRLIDPYSMRPPPTTIDTSPIDSVLLWAHGQHRADTVWQNEAGDRPYHIRGTTRIVTYHPHYRTPETSTFHLPFGEVTITLEDVATLTGLPIDGDPVIVDIPDEEWSAMCVRLLGQSPTEVSRGAVRISWLRDEFNRLPANASSETTQQYARAYALYLMGGVLFPDRSGGMVHLQYLLLVEDWQRAGRFAWGAAVLAYLYREMGMSVLLMTQSSSLGGDLGGWVPLLQLWVWERFPQITLRHTETMEPITVDTYPRGARWLPANTRQHGNELYQYKLFFDELSTIVWCPYSARDEQFRVSVIRSDTFRALVPLICFSAVMWHYPDRVLRQFGMLQNVPHQPHSEFEIRYFLRQTTRGSSRGQQLLHVYIESLDLWSRRHEYIATMPFSEETLAYHSEYLEWYRDVTRRAITRGGAVMNAVYDIMEYVELSLRDGVRNGGTSADQLTEPDVSVPVQRYPTEHSLAIWPERTDPTPGWGVPEPQFRQEPRRRQRRDQRDVPHPVRISDRQRVQSVRHTHSPSDLLRPSRRSFSQALLLPFSQALLRPFSEALLRHFSQALLRPLSTQTLMILCHKIEKNIQAIIIHNRHRIMK